MPSPHDEEIRPPAGLRPEYLRPDRGDVAHDVYRSLHPNRAARDEWIDEFCSERGAQR